MIKLDARLKPIEVAGQRIITTKALAEGYGTTPDSISYNFNRNREHYAEGKHCYCLEGQAKHEFVNRHEIHDGSKNAKTLYLWTEKGALLHAKSLNTQKAWDVYDALVETYFRTKQMFTVPQTLPEALRMAADLAEQMERQAPLVAFAETAARSETSILIRELAKICCKNGMNIGERRLYKRLREWGLLMPNSTEPYQEYVDRGYFEVAEGTHENDKGVFLHSVTRVLPKGQQYIISRLKKDA
ncbi:MAG: phage antirepressor KilAC domain-containing protein [Thermaerobacter sp.]|nr:phage antirepressor KilAC domain-containing protein [Thermaerobacter sp.]